MAKQRLLGMETEYGFAPSVYDSGTPSKKVLQSLINRAKQDYVCASSYYDSDVFLSNGGRLYIDLGHPEYSTPEAPDPYEITRHVKAGDRIVAGLCEKALKKHSYLLFKNNVDPLNPSVTYGSHESYLHMADPASLPSQLIPHLVSRIVFTGAGGLNNRSSGIEFLLSPRVPHFTRCVSSESTRDRGIYHTKNEPLCKDWNRLHVISGESLMGELGTLLRLGTTQLVVALAEGGLCPHIELQAPLEAMRIFSSDPFCTAVAPLSCGKKLSAIDIQRRYAQAVEKNLALLPSWADKICQRWNDMLDLLQKDAPYSCASRLDWATKWVLFDQRIRNRGFDWERTNVCSKTIQRIVADPDWRVLGINIHTLNVDKLLALMGPYAELLDKSTQLLHKHGMNWELLKSLMDLRNELCEIDLRFGQLDDDKGLFHLLDRSGVMEHHVEEICETDVVRAMTEPPSFGRAKLRGEAIKQTGSMRSCYAWWDRVIDWGNKKVLDLSDPFCSKPNWLHYARSEYSQEEINPDSLSGTVLERLLISPIPLHEWASVAIPSAVEERREA